MVHRDNNRRLPILLILILFALAGCRAELSEEARAENALGDFFAHLSLGQYREAAELYEGSYEILISFNPDLDPVDHPALWERACTVNGYQCLELRELLEVEEFSPGSYYLTVTLQTAEGDIYQRGPCCGAGASDEPPHTEFTFRVVRDEGGQFKVLDPPVYVP